MISVTLKYIIIKLNRLSSRGGLGVKLQQCSNTVATFCFRWIESRSGRLYGTMAVIIGCYPLMVNHI